VDSSLYAVIKWGIVESSLRKFSAFSEVENVVYWIILLPLVLMEYDTTSCINNSIVCTEQFNKSTSEMP
jgi:hypothetical protein